MQDSEVRSGRLLLRLRTGATAAGRCSIEEPDGESHSTTATAYRTLTSGEPRLHASAAGHGQIRASAKAPSGHASPMTRLYERPLVARRTGPLYNAFSYPTKIDPEVIGVFIAAHTKPGQSVLDVFGGSGTTGVAASLCDRPTARMQQIAREAGLDVEWGPRTAHVYELSPIGALVGEVMACPCDPDAFRSAARDVLTRARSDVEDWYAAAAPDGTPGRIRYVIWSEVLRTPCCDNETSLYEASVRLAPASMESHFVCAHCAMGLRVDECERVSETVLDPITGDWVVRRRRVPVRIYGRSGSVTWSRGPTPEDLKVLDLVPLMPADWVPAEKVEWGDLYRSGYHQGISHFHHFYTQRNLAVLARLWALASEHADPAVRKALQVWVLSYNASHSTVLSRVVAKKSQKDFVVTGAQSGVLYVSGLPVEKNVIDGLNRKIRTLHDAFSLTFASRSTVNVTCGSSTQLRLADDSVDYVFTDPPFGGYIPYAEINQINEAWLGRLTDRASEVIVSSAQDKTVSEYRSLLASVFCEVSRVLKPDGYATVIFHASQPAVWEALGEAFVSSGLCVDKTSVLDKCQVSFKQVVSEGGTRDDAVFLLSHRNSQVQKPPRGRPRAQFDAAEAIRDLVRTAAGSASELTAQRMWSRFAAESIHAGSQVPVGTHEFYGLVEQHRSRVLNTLSSPTA